MPPIQGSWVLVRSTAEAYRAAGQAASALHAMALLQTYQAKAFKHLYEGSSDQGLMQELRTATDLALVQRKSQRGPSVRRCPLWWSRNDLWLDLADMGESDKHCFLDSPISQAGLSGDAVESFAQQFSIAQKRADTFCPGGPLLSSPCRRVAAPLPARRRGRLPAAPSLAPAWLQQQPSLRPQRGAGSRKVAQPVSAPARPMKCQGKRRSWDGRTRDTGSCSSGDGESAPSPGGGRGGKSFSLLGCSATGSPACGTQTSEQCPFFSGSQEARMAVHETQSPHSRPPLLSPMSSRVRSEDAMPSPAPPAQPWSQVSVALRTQTPLRNALPSESGPCAPLRCPTAGSLWLPWSRLYGLWGPG